MTDDLTARIQGLGWSRIEKAIAEDGYSTTGPLIEPTLARSLIDLWPEDERFRSRIEMRRHGYGEGTYGYFANPLPDAIASLRETFYPPLSRIANGMMASLGRDVSYPDDLDAFRTRCHEAGQTKPTPLLLRYGPGGYNRLHRDLYGELAFPLQLTILLNDPDEFEGGEFMLVENRMRMQARGEVVRLRQGEAIIFPTMDRPTQGAKGLVRAEMRHGVSRGEKRRALRPRHYLSRRCLNASIRRTTGFDTAGIT